MRFKKITSIFLTAALLISMLPVFGSAEETEIFKVGVEAMTAASTVSDSPIIYNQGEEITVQIRASQNTGITSIKLLIDYDEAVLEPVEGKYSVSNLFTAYDSLTAKNGYFMFYSDNYPKVTEATGVFAQITFVAKDVCAADQAITVKPFTDGSCVKMTVTGMEVVPFALEAYTFAVHKINKEAGVVTLPTCTEQGYTTYACEACKASVVGNIVEAKGHTPAEAVVENTVAPTCTVDGSYESVVYCAVESCKTELSRETKVIPMLGHTAKPAVEENRVEATCTTDGKYDTVVYCATCNEELSRETVVLPKLGHTAKPAVEENRVEPTCTMNGSYDSVVYCSVCNAEVSRDKITITMLPHNLEKHEGQEATHTQIGWNPYETCKDCDFTTYVEIPMVPYLPGDVTGDDLVTDADAIYLLYATFDAENYPLNQEADYNSDGVVTDADAIYLLYATFDPENYPLRNN